MCLFLLECVKKNTLGTLFVFQVIRFQKKLLNLKEHPIPSLGLSVVLHRESFCILTSFECQMLPSVMPKQAAPLLSPLRICVFSLYVFMYLYTHHPRCTLVIIAHCGSLPNETFPNHKSPPTAYFLLPTNHQPLTTNHYLLSYLA